jgi:hypothetical protein
MKIFMIILSIVVFASCINTHKLEDSKDKEEIDFMYFDPSETDFLIGYPVYTWLRLSPADLGCFFERTDVYRDSRFNCQIAEYQNNGDPCVNTEEYYEGFNLPESVVKELCPVISSMTMDFEHGELRSIYIEFTEELSAEEIATYLNIPQFTLGLPLNLMSISLDDGVDFFEAGDKVSKSITLVGFEHVGAGEVDCD